MVRRLATTAFTSLLLATAAGACLSGDPDGEDIGPTWDEANAKADDPNADGVTGTKTDSVRLLDGFDKLLDTSAGACVEPLGGQLAYSVGNVAKPFDVYVVSSREDLAKKVGVDLDAKIRFASVSGGPTLAFVDSFQQSRTAVNLLVAARASYRVTQTHGVVLTDEAKGWLETDPRLFLHRCGNFYVNGIEHEAQLFVLIHFDLKSVDAMRSISGQLGLSGGIGPVNLDGTLKANLETVAKRADVTVETHVLDRGFLVDGGTGALMGSLLEGTINADTFAKIDSVRAAMLQSLQGDVCRDGGGTGVNCTGVTPGYTANTTRYAVPVRVDLRAYSRAQNAPLGGADSPYQAMRALIEPADQYLRTLSRAAARLDAIDHDEIQPFLAASPAMRLRYGLAAPAAPIYNQDALVATARSYASRLDAARSSVAELAASCWSSALEGDLAACAPPSGTSAAALPALKGIDAAIADYAAHARIVPVQLVSAGVKTYPQTHDACATLGTRLPTLDEARRLTFALATPSLPRSPNALLQGAAWHAETATCAMAGGSPAVKYATGTATCVTGTAPAMTTVCVPSQGPFAGLRAL